MLYSLLKIKKKQNLNVNTVEIPVNFNINLARQLMRLYVFTAFIKLFKI